MIKPSIFSVHVSQTQRLDSYEHGCVQAGAVPHLHSAMPQQKAVAHCLQAWGRTSPVKLPLTAPQEEQNMHAEHARGVVVLCTSQKHLQYKKWEQMTPGFLLPYLSSVMSASRQKYKSLPKASSPNSLGSRLQIVLLKVEVVRWGILNNYNIPTMSICKLCSPFCLDYWFLVSILFPITSRLTYKK